MAYMSTLSLPPDSRLLVVEDMDSLRLYLCETLEELAGVSQVVGVSDGIEALAAIAEAEQPFDLILTDITMPRMDGETLIGKLQEQRYPAALVVLSAHGQDDLIIRCMRGGAVDYLIKPVSINDLYTAVVAAVQHAPDPEIDIHVDYDPFGWFEVCGTSSYSVLYRYRRFLGLLSKLHIPEEVANEVRLALEELGRNAIEWGNRGQRDKRISLSCRILPSKVILVITDEGEGFDPRILPDPSHDPIGHIEQRQKEGKRLGGYGIHLVRNIMDKITWNDAGNKVIAVKYLHPRS
ncbi:MAG: response regulator [Planctomycetota bacterium]|nr:MAG: response regulator [Planctomycetota bacterium]